MARLVYHVVMVTLLAGILSTLYLALPSVVMPEVRVMMAPLGCAQQPKSL